MGSRLIFLHLPTLKVTEWGIAYGVTEVPVEPSLRAKRMQEPASKKSEWAARTVNRHR